MSITFGFLAAEAAAPDANTMSAAAAVATRMTSLEQQVQVDGLLAKLGYSCIYRARSRRARRRIRLYVRATPYVRGF